MKDTTHNLRQVYYALRYCELISEARHMLNVLDCDLLDEDAIDNSRDRMTSLEIFAEQIAESLRNVATHS